MNTPSLARPRRRWSLMAAATLTVAALVSGCQSSPTSDTAGTAPSPDEKGGVALSQWYHEYGEPGVKKAVEGYAADYPDAEVKVQWTPGDYGSVLGSSLLTDDAPDVFEFEQGGSLDMIRSGQLADLTDIVEPVKDQFNESVIKRFEHDGKFYAVPQAIDMQVLYYRPSLLKEAGVDVPKTFDELVAAAQAVDKKGTAGGFFAGNDAGVGVLGTILLWASGNEQLNNDRTDVAFLNEDFYRALESYRDFVKSGAVVRGASNDWSSPDAFINGEAAFQWTGLWALPEVEEALGDDFGVIAFPAIGANGRPVVPFGAFGASVNAKSENVEEAKKYVKWLWVDQEDKQLDFATAYGTHIPAKDALADRSDTLSSGPGADAVRFVKENGVTNDIMWSGTLGESFNAAVSNVVLKDADPRSEFSGFEKQAREELGKLQQ
ncbi:ABC transporter substrate-binding protein [Corynebacterium liangguodongii]|uniref:ABC transporter substrate-binding protein n=1 Tax=Corynebacterium liangguodongii TaxID=2079535 RepID=A0A2S0WF68_9CORY|nr:sugar ABC transporter substrate-binding protein [Corynebacterium liangguodongii]AWB84409.1 ABC transporter substrate-binding protein [Corynebacterium liangguodongii]PWB99899.1 sugar ABC transporter substrate-binding protein [Corynebacterium liangguodongii]